MIYLLLSILFSALLVIFFKIFDRRNVPVFQAIVYNYISATTIAFWFLPDSNQIISGEVLKADWVPFALLLGSLFIVVFNLTSLTTIRYGVSTASLAMKLGLIFPVLLAFTIYGESFNWMKLVGIILAFVAVVLTSIKEDEDSKTHKASFAFLPVIVFFGSGLCDSMTQFANKHYLGSKSTEEFSFFLFLAASLAGILILVYQLLSGKSKFNVGSLIGGVVLGIVNYFSFLFLLKALGSIEWGSSVVFPISNLGTVAVATVVGIFFFHEKISKTNAVGLAFALASISIIILTSV